MLHALIIILLMPISILANGEADPVLSDYNQIADLYGADPITRKWCLIKHFKILEAYAKNSAAIEKKNLDLYANFWAYDPKAQAWRRVGLLNYFEKKNKQPLVQSSLAPLKSGRKESSEGLLDELILCKDQPPIGASYFWSRFAIKFNLGFGALFCRNSLSNMYGFLQDDHYFIADSSTPQHVYKPNWFYKNFNQVDGINLPTDSHRAFNPLFKGQSTSFLVNLSLVYYCSKRLFLDIGRTIVFNYCPKLWCNAPIFKTNPFVMSHRWTAQGKWLAKLGCYFWHIGSGTFFGDFGLVYAHHVGSAYAKALVSTTYLHQSLGYNPGIGYEHHMGAKLFLVHRLSFEWQHFRQFLRSNPYNVTYTFPAIYLEVGLGIRR